MFISVYLVQHYTVEYRYVDVAHRPTPTDVADAAAVVRVEPTSVLPLRSRKYIS